MVQTKKQQSKNQRSSFKRYILYFWTFLLVIFFSVVLFMAGIANEWFGNLPSTQQLENPETNLASKVYSQDGELLGKYFTQNRSNVAFDELSPHLVNALIATEDARFYKHPGIDVIALFRVFFYRILLGQEGAGGGSTITQQLAKNLFPRQEFDTWSEIIVRKLKEWVIAARLERYYTKEEIIQMYFNTVSFGSNTYGIQAATNTFFNKSPKELKPEEASVLVGALKATRVYSPVYNPDNSKSRRNVVLHQMVKQDYLANKKFDSLKDQKIDLNYNVESNNQGDARYFRSHLRQKLDEWCNKNGYNLYTDGLKIYTTINSRMQKHAQQAIQEHMSQLQSKFFNHWEGYGSPWGQDSEIIDNAVRQSDRYKKMEEKGLSQDSIMAVFNKPVEMKVFSYDGPKDTVMSPLDSIKYYKHFLHAGFMAMRPSNGHVKAWVGGIDFKHFKYDHVNKRAKRQVGSTFKPFVYTKAVDEGFSPCMEMPNTPIVFEEYDNWSPKNATGEYGGMVPIKNGLGKSINCLTARLIKRVSPGAVVEMARDMGITSPMKAYPSIALGTPDISVFEMTSAFNTYANKGVWREPTYLTKIEDKNGNVLEKFIGKNREVLKEVTNYIMLDMLKHVVNNGTAVRLRYKYNFENPIAGKTGTTQNQSDGWFLGAVPNLTGGVWVGGSERSISFRSIKLGQGANMALPIWAKFMKKCYADEKLNVSKDKFEEPQEELPVEIDCKKFEEKENQQSEDIQF